MVKLSSVSRASLFTTTVAILVSSVCVPAIAAGNMAQNNITSVASVKESNSIGSVKFEGNKKLDDAALRAEIETKSFGPMSKNKLASDALRIKELYRKSGRNDAVVDYKFIQAENGKQDVIFVVNEGEKVKIGSINFVGNKAYSDWRLKDIITTTETNWLSWIKNSDVYDPDRLAADQEMLRRHYMKNGYPDFRVLSSVADFDKEKNSYFITFTVDEGPEYKVGTVNVESTIPGVNASQYQGVVSTRSGDVFSVEKVDRSLEDINLAFARQGQPFVQARPRGERIAAEGKVNVTYVIEEGPHIYVERINVRGNTRTMDHVIRREFDISEGDAYNRVLIDRAERRLKNLGFFKVVKVSRDPGSKPDKVVLNVDVQEQPTGELSLGAGYSTGDGIIGDVSIGEKNFLGRGQQVKLAVGYGQRRQSADFSFTEPYFMGTRIAAGFDIFARKTVDAKYVSYDSETKGFGLRAAMPLNENVTLATRYKYIDQTIDIRSFYKDGSIANGEASRVLKAAEGSSVVSLLGYSLTYNGLDNDKSPTKGLLASIGQDFAGVGGDVSFVQSVASARFYYPVWNDIVFMVKGQGGLATGIGSPKERINGAFFKGYDLVRGFAASGIGPRDISTSNLDALGGMAYYGAGAELQFPVFGLPEEYGFRAALFADAGALYDVGKLGNLATQVTLKDDNSLRTSIGASLIWTSPFGPLRFDFAKTINKESYDRTQPFRFSAGTTF